MKRNHPSTVFAPSRSSVTTILLALFLATFAVASANATTITWSNAGGGAWSNAANWSPASVPGSGDVAVLPSLSGAYTVTLDTNPSAAELDIAAGDPSLDVNGHSITALTLVENYGTIRNFTGPYSSDQLKNRSGGFVYGATDGVISMTGGSTVVNDGTIVVGPGSSSQLYSGGIVSIGGSGTLKLDHTKVVDATGAPQAGGWLKILAGQTLTGTGSIEKRIWNYGTWVVDDNSTTLRVPGLTYNYGTLRIENGATLYAPMVSCEQGGVLTSGSGGGTLDARITEGGVPNGNLGGLSLLHGGSILIDGGDLNLHVGALYGGSIQRSGDTGVLTMDAGSMQQVSIASGAEVLWNGWEQQELAEHVHVDGLLRIAGQFWFLKTDTASTDSMWFSGVGTIHLEDGTIGTGVSGTVVIDEGMTVTGHGTINPPFVNWGTVDLDGGRIAIPSAHAILNHGVMKFGDGLVVSGAGVSLRNMGQLTIGGGSRIEKGAAIDNRGGVLTVATRGSLAIGTTSTMGTLTGGRLEGEGTGEFTVTRGGTLKDATLGRTGVLHVASNATAVLAGARFTNLGTVRVDAGGRISTDGTTQYLQTDGATTLAGGTLLSNRDVQIQAGALRGFGVVSANLVNRGTVTPDVGANALRIAGNYTQATGGILQCSLAGAAANQMSHFDVAGKATLGGSLAPALVGGYLPASGLAFPVFTFGSISGSFDPMLTASGSGTAVPQFVTFFQDGAMSLVTGGTTAVGDAPTAIGTLRFFGRTTTTGTSFVLALPYAAELKGRVYDAAGREVAKLADGAQPAGLHTFAMSGADRLASGVYFARMNVVHDGVGEVRIARAVVIR